MCLTIEKLGSLAPKPKTATVDMEVYKVLAYNTYTGELHAPYYKKFYYTIGVTQTAKLQSSNELQYFPCHVSSYEDHDTDETFSFEIEQGLHSFKDIEFAIKLMDQINQCKTMMFGRFSTIAPQVFKALIPAGSTYYEGYFDWPKEVNYASSALRIVEKV